MSISKKIRTMMLPVVAAMMMFAPYHAQAAQAISQAEMVSMTSTTVSQSGDSVMSINGDGQAMLVGDQAKVSSDDAMALSTETMSDYAYQVVALIDDSQAMASVDVLADQADNTTGYINHVGASGYGITASTGNGLVAGLTASDALLLSRTTSMTG